jgi:CheY-like chemotaxis protein
MSASRHKGLEKRRNDRGLGDSAGRCVAGKSGIGRVLVVDSDPYRRTFLVQMLMETGRRVLMAGSGEGARGILSHLATRVDAVIVSSSLDEESGIEVVRQLRQEWPDPLYLLATGQPFDPAAEGVPQLVRPITREKLLALLD